MTKVFPIEVDGCESLGRNGFAKTKGIELWLIHNVVSLTPFTSRGQPQRCNIEMSADVMTKMAIFWLKLRSPEERTAAIAEINQQ